MDRTFIITVGTGRTHEDMINLAKGISELLDDMRPEKIIFAGSKKSRKTVELIEQEYSKNNEKQLKYEFHEITKIDNVIHTFDEISQKIKENNNTKIYINYTSGTKSMSVAAALCSVVYKTKLMSLSGERNQQGIVEHQRGQYNTQNLYSVYDQFNKKNMKRYFNMYRFEQTIETCEEIVDFNEKDTYKQVFEYYNKWDKFNHKNKLDTIDNTIFTDEKFKKQFIKNQKSIKYIKRIQDPLSDYYILADLINNSQRRYEEGKYDDAIARLYRSIELIAQIRLKHKYDIKTENIDLLKIKNKVSPNYYGKLNKRKGRIQLALKQDYKLLTELNDPIGKYFKEQDEIKTILNARNHSILAHGTNSISKEKYDEMKKLTIQIATKLKPEISIYIDETKFPKFTIKE